MTTTRIAKHLQACHALVADLQAAEDTARRLHRFITMRAINRAKNALGWELAGRMDAADAAAFDKPIPRTPYKSPARFDIAAQVRLLGADSLLPPASMPGRGGRAR